MWTVLFFEINVFVKKLKPSLFVQCKSVCAKGFFFIFLIPLTVLILR